jgi:UDP-2,3-diacylglucosamine pyrophosphatase LpxH
MEENQLSVSQRLDQVLNAAKMIPLTMESKLVFFSDCHRGINDWADDFAHNQIIFFHAIQQYNQQNFTYIEVGDGDEMWENRNFSEIRKAHSHIFWELSKFYRAGRLIMLYGNHDIEKRYPKISAKELYSYYEERSGEVKQLFPNIKVHESLLLQPADGGTPILVLHGHQADPANDRFWRFGKFFSRFFWKNLQLLGIHDPTSAAKNYYKANKVESSLMEWTAQSGVITISGHTHRPRFPDKFDVPYYNTGSCVHPRCITAIEIARGEIILVKWCVASSQNGVLTIQRQEIEGPRRLIGG